jgi:hypothetical protein
MKENVIKRNTINCYLCQAVCWWSVAEVLHWCVRACKTTAWVCHLLTNRLVSSLNFDDISSLTVDLCHS